jgi:hypothetical protein
MWSTPTEISNDILDFSRSLNCDWVGAITVEYEPAYDYDNCHTNVDTHLKLYGGESIIGWYIINGDITLQAIRHTVWNKDNKLVDVTPYKDNRDFIIFARSRVQNKDYSVPNCYIQSLDKYFMQETEIMYYVYQLVDPRDKQPFYIGKGTGRRANTHLWEIPETRNKYKENKIASIRSAGLEPIIEYVAENIIDDGLAYDIEATLIRKYGRKGYDKNGILTNICEDARPPNYKGKTYEEIYGSEKAKEQRDLRSRLQKERGGYGPKQHSKQTKDLFSTLNSGPGNPMFGKTQSEYTKQLISEKAKARIGKLNKKSHCYILTSPDRVEHILYGSEANNFCKQYNLSWSTLKMQIQKNWPIPKKGKTKGWKLEVRNCE